jgi:glucosamine--fructose-6-phosphate aminotransferase (isomerizing)
VALEAALKLSEAACIHAHAYAAGELRHGPLTLVRAGLPVVLIANQPPLRQALLATAASVRAHGARVIAVADEDDEEIARHAEHVLRVPRVPGPLGAVVAAVPLQILAYQIGRLRGMDVDQPRHLGKSVVGLG